jgi:hypothetical protein
MEAPMGLDQMLMEFAKKPPTGAFPQIARADVVDGLRDRVAPGGAKNISQLGSSLCGPAAVMFCVATRLPEMYAQYVMDLYDKGQAQFGTLKVKPSDACRNYDPKKIAPVDWVALASLRDSDNRYMSYAAVENEAAGITLPKSVAGWFRAAGYSQIYQSTQLFGGMVQNDHEIARAGTDRLQGRDVCLLINAKMLASMDSPSATPNHWIVLTKAIRLDTKKREIALEIFTWGDVQNLPYSGSANLDDFLRNYYGYVSAR